ncbi:hypothetical protein TELCIR_14206, partial [Teladorsagia circumcincta]
PRPLLSGVPQGGVLSPILFSIYVHELASLVASCGVECVCFADDIKIYKQITTPEDCNILQRALDLTASWSKDWCLPLSKEKTKFMRFHIRSTSTSCAPSYYIDGKTIEKVDKVMDLGFLMKSDLNCDSHCEK